MHLQITVEREAVEIGGLGTSQFSPDYPGKLAILGVANRHFRNRMGENYGESCNHTFITFVLTHKFQSTLWWTIENLNDGSSMWVKKPLLEEIFGVPDGRHEQMVSPEDVSQYLFRFEREVFGELRDSSKYLYAVAKKLTQELRQVARDLREGHAHCRKEIDELIGLPSRTYYEVQRPLREDWVGAEALRPAFADRDLRSYIDE